MPRRAVILAALALAPASDLAAAPRKGGLTLEQVVFRAQRGPRARAAREKTNEARGVASETRGYLFPHIEINGLAAPSPNIRCIDVACTETNNKNPTIAFAGIFGRLELSAAQPLYSFGKLAAGERAADHGVRAAKALEGVTAAEVAMQAVEAYFGLKLARETRWMLEEGRERVTGALEKVNRDIESGSGGVTLQDRYRLETLAAEVDFRLAEARGKEAQALAGIRVLVGDPDADVDSEPLDAVDFKPGAENGYVARARVSEPTVRAATEGREAADALARLEKARYLPDLLVVGRLTLARATGVDDPPSAFANDPFNTVSAGAGLALRWKLDPLAQRGRVAQARAKARRATALAEAAGRQADFKAREAYARVAQRSQQLEVARRGAKSARAWLASTLQAEAVGAIDQKDLADAYLAVFTARARTLAAIHDWNLAVYQLRQATGEFPPSPGV